MPEEKKNLEPGRDDAPTPEEDNTVEVKIRGKKKEEEPSDEKGVASGEKASGGEDPSDAGREESSAEEGAATEDRPIGGEKSSEEKETTEEGDFHGESDMPGLDPSMFALPADVASLVRIFIPMLAESAWQNLGLIARPGTTEVSMDLGQVKLAIDSIDSLFTTLQGEMEEREKREIQGLLTNLRLNFVEKSSAGNE